MGSGLGGGVNVGRFEGTYVGRFEGIGDRRFEGTGNGIAEVEVGSSSPARGLLLSSLLLLLSLLLLEELSISLFFGRAETTATTSTTLITTITITIAKPQSILFDLHCNLNRLGLASCTSPLALLVTSSSIAGMVLASSLIMIAFYDEYPFTVRRRRKE